MAADVARTAIAILEECAAIAPPPPASTPMSFETLHSICVAEMAARGISRTQMFRNLSANCAVGWRDDLLALLVDSLTSGDFPPCEESVIAIRAGLDAWSDRLLEERLFAAIGGVFNAIAPTAPLQDQGSRAEPCPHGP